MVKRLLSIIIIGFTFTVMSVNAQHIEWFKTLSKLKNNNQTNRQSLLLQSSYTRAGAVYPDSVLNYSWDTISKSWDTSNFVIYKYNTNHQVTSILTKQFYTSKFINSRKETHVYNANGKILQLLITRWYNNNWLNDSITITHYNSYGNIVFESSQFWMGNDWVTAWADSSNYNWSGGRLTSKTDYYYDNNSLTFYPYELYQFSYHGSSRIPYQALISYYNGTGFDSVGKYTNTQWKLGFDSVNFNEPTDYTIVGYNTSNIWANMMKKVSNVSGNLLMKDTLYKWETDINKWADSSNERYTYNANHQILSFFNTKILGTVSDTTEIDSFAYDSKGNMTLNTYWQYDNIANYVIQYFGEQYLYTYDNNNTSLILSMITKEFDFVSNHYLNSNKAVYFPGVLPSDISSAISDMSVRIYPNPVSDKLIIRIQPNQFKAIIYSIEGKMIRQLNLPDDVNEINTTNIPDGIYILKIFNDNSTILKRFIKE